VGCPPSTCACTHVRRHLCAHIVHVLWFTASSDRPSGADADTDGDRDMDGDGEGGGDGDGDGDHLREIRVLGQVEQRQCLSNRYTPELHTVQRAV
jgi:hypothetical protein